MKQTIRTIEYPIAQRQPLSNVQPVTTPAARLRRISWVDFHHYSTSFRRFVGKILKEHTPGHIANTTGQTMLMQHTVDLYIFHRYLPVTIDNLSTMLVTKVVSPPADTFVDTGHYLTSFAAERRTLFSFGELTLSAGQCLFFFAGKAGVSIATPSERAAKVLSPTSIPTLLASFGRMFGSHSTEKQM